MIPATLDTAAAFRSMFYTVVQNGYSILDRINVDWSEEDPDCYSDYDRDDIRVDFSNAICEAAEALGLECYTAEQEGELADLIMDSWQGLNGYFIHTSE